MILLTIMFTLSLTMVFRAIISALMHSFALGLIAKDKGQSWSTQVVV